MGRFFAAMVLIIMLGWLGPMCAKLGTQDPVVTMPAPVPQPKSPAPATKRPPLAVATYRSRKMFPVENDKHVVSVLRANKADVPAVGVTMTLSTRVKGQLAERAEGGPGQTLAGGTTSYFGLGISTVVFDKGNVVR